VAGALRFELLSEGQVIPRGRKREGTKALSKSRPGRSPREKVGKARKDKPGKVKSGKSKKGKSWKR
jgi:ribonuclease R